MSVEKKIYLFPLFTEKSETDFSNAYTRFLKEKLQKTGVFEVFEINEINNVLNDYENIFNTVKEAVNVKSSQMNLNSIVFGYLIKKDYGHDVRVIFYSAKDKEIISDFTDRLYNDSGIELSVKNCSVQFAARILSIDSSRMFFASLFMPGLGQFINRSYLKGTLFLGGFAYCLIKNSSIESPKSLGQLRNFSSQFDGRNTRYFIDGREYSYETWIQIFNDQEDQVKRNEENKKEKNKLKIYMGAIYLVNILDALITSKRYNNKKTIERRLSLNVDHFGRRPEICLKYRF